MVKKITYNHLKIGADIGTLTVYTLSNNVQNAIWSKSYDQGKPWRIARVNVDVAESFKIIFEAKRGSGSKGNHFKANIKLGHETILLTLQAILLWMIFYIQTGNV